MKQPKPPNSPEAARPGRAVLVAAVLCNGIEFFDFVAYAFFAHTIGKVFFPTAEPALSLLLSVGVFGVGFIARPVGGVILGRYADSAGRRPALLLSAVLMTVGTAGLVLVPGYAVIGVAAPVLITLFRLIQGFALGGETGPSTAFLLEVAPPDQRAVYVSLQIASQGIAMVLAGSLGLALSLTLTADQMLEWGWRVPFLASVALIPIALFLRRCMPETLTGEHRAPPGAPAPSWRAHPVILGILVIAGGTVSTYVGNYMTTYGTVILKLPAADGFQAAMLTGFATLTGAIVGGYFADRLGYRSMILWPRFAVAAIAIPAFDWLAAHPDGRTLQAISATLAFLTALTAGGVLTAICELFPPHRRAAGLAMVYSIGVSVFGGSTQPAVTWLIAITESPLAPAWCIAATSGVAIIATIFLFRHRPSAVQPASTAV